MSQFKKMFDHSNLPMNIVIALIIMSWLSFFSVLLFA